MPEFVVILFLGNLLLTLVDASLAYRKAEFIVTFVTPGNGTTEAGVRRIRRFLPLMVALYTLLNCYAYSLHHLGYLAGMTLLLTADIVLQWHLAGRGEKVDQ